MPNFCESFCNFMRDFQKGNKQIMYQKTYQPGKGTTYFFADDYPKANGEVNGDESAMFKDLGYDLVGMQNDITLDLIRFAKNMPDCIGDGNKIVVEKIDNCETVSIEKKGTNKN
jgi:hypothetical protein